MSTLYDVNVLSVAFPIFLLVAMAAHFVMQQTESKIEASWIVSVLSLANIVINLYALVLTDKQNDPYDLFRMLAVVICLGIGWKYIPKQPNKT